MKNSQKNRTYIATVQIEKIQKTQTCCPTAETATSPAFYQVYHLYLVLCKILLLRYKYSVFSKNGIDARLEKTGKIWRKKKKKVLLSVLYIFKFDSLGDKPLTRIILQLFVPCVYTWYTMYSTILTSSTKSWWQVLLYYLHFCCHIITGHCCHIIADRVSKRKTTYCTVT